MQLCNQHACNHQRATLLDYNSFIIKHHELQKLFRVERKKKKTKQETFSINKMETKEKKGKKESKIKETLSLNNKETF